MNYTRYKCITFTCSVTLNLKMLLITNVLNVFTNVPKLICLNDL